MLINTSLLRERFLIEKSGLKEDPLVALGNRILLPLISRNGKLTERFVVRAHSMHMALRMASYITQEFYKSGPIVNRPKTLDWKNAWFDMTTDFERPHTPETWVSVYHNGKIIFKDGEHHPFLDVIEQCDVKNREEYDRAIVIAEDIFKQAGKSVNIDHQINIAFVIGAMEKQARCGLILRVPNSTSTFNFQIAHLKGENDTPVETVLPEHIGFELAADFLEGIQLSVTSAFTEQQIKNKKIQPLSPEAKKMHASFKRIGRLNASISAFENMYAIKYRPERPDFTQILEDIRNSEQNDFE
jgi:hypothetical protein